MILPIYALNIAILFSVVLDLRTKEVDRRFSLGLVRILFILVVAGRNLSICLFSFRTLCYSLFLRFRKLLCPVVDGFFVPVVSVHCL